jgi:DNA-binding MarR family transcriptional regulator
VPAAHLAFETLALGLYWNGEATIARRRDVFQLTNDELSILCWLRISNGQAILSASAVAENSLFVVPDRLLQDGYVTTQMLSPTAVHYTLTESGREVLEICESTAYFAAVAKRKWPRANTPDPHLG